MFFMTWSSSSMPITSVIYISLSIFIKLLLSCNTRSTTTAFEDFAEIKILASPYSFRRHFEFLTYLFKHFFCDEGLIISCVPITTSFWVLKLPIVERAIKDTEYSTQREFFPIFCSKSFLMSKFPHLSSTKTITCHPFKHLLDKRGFLLVNFYMAFFTDSSTSYKFIAERYTSWSHSKFTFSPESSRYVFSPVIILKFCLATEDHEEKFLIWIIGKCRSVGTNLY